MPWWAAVLIAVTATLAGFAIEAGSGSQELGPIFAVCYALGCVAAALAVRQSGLFTAVIQPPLLLFVAVPLAYFLMHNSSFNGLKDIAISCGYPLIERFPLMLFTSAAVLLIGLFRWYHAMSAPAQASAPAAARARPPRQSLFAGLAAKLSSAFAGNGTEADDADGPVRPRHGIDRSADPARRRPGRPPRERVAAGPRRRPSTTEVGDLPPRPWRQPARPPHPDADRYAEPPRRRSRDAREPGELRRTPPPPPRRAPRERGDHRERRDYRDYPEQYPAPRPARGSRFDPYETDRQARRNVDPYPPQGPRRRPAPAGSETSHHPVSRVRYRDSRPESDQPDGLRHRPGR